MWSSKLMVETNVEIGHWDHWVWQYLPLPQGEGKCGGHEWILVGRLEGGWWNYTTYEEMKVWMKWRCGGWGENFSLESGTRAPVTKWSTSGRVKTNQLRESVASEVSYNFWYLFTKVLHTFVSVTAHTQVCANQQLEGRIAELDHKNAQHHAWRWLGTHR